MTAIEAAIAAGDLQAPDGRTVEAVEEVEEVTIYGIRDGTAAYSRWFWDADARNGVLRGLKDAAKAAGLSPPVIDERIAPVEMHCSRVMASAVAGFPG